jgi:hypothetical protein
MNCWDMSTSLLLIYICTVQITISEVALLGYVYIIPLHLYMYCTNNYLRGRIVGI